MSGVGVENIPPVEATARATVDGGRMKPSAGKKAGSTGSSGRTGSTGSSGRRMLQTLQPSGKNKKLLVGSDGLVRLGSGGKKDIKIYKDPEGPRTSTPERKEPVLASKHVQAAVQCTSTETQVEDRDTAQYRAEQIMYGAEEDLPLEYWKDLAEKRREALENSLHENEELHTSISFLEEENEKLAKEKEEFKSLAERAQELVNILNSVVSDDDNDDNDDNEDVAGDGSDPSEQEPSQQSQADQTSPSPLHGPE